MNFTFAPATKNQAKARIAFAGPSGSGKTYTSLITATALGERVAVIDTERGSASKYADEFAFDTLHMHTYDPRQLVRALAAAGEAGYDAVVVDSLSHFWMGVGGMLEQVDAAAKRSGGGNTFAGWKEARPMERQMVDALLAYPGHVVVTMRTKTEYVVEENDRGKKIPRKIGTKPEQRDGIEYEFDIVGDLDLDNTLVVAKSRCKPLAKAVIREPDAGFGKQVLDWLTDGADPGMSVMEVRRQALDPATGFEELGVLYKAEDGRGRLGAAVADEDGEPTTLGALLARLGNARKPKAGT
ncbi:ATP-binding protein [Salinispora arenicola]|uniref:ATP-binding protein n=1 Tax=Salinispora arenicola TaxID=168697 RepID=UPI00037A8809|nr:ATP-binding protein [Salinispora arenicola]